MEITEVKIRRLTRDAKLRAIVSVTFDDVFAVHDIKVIQGQNGLFIAMPNRRIPDGTFRDIVHPIDSGFREMLSERVIDCFEAVLETVGEEQESVTGRAGD